MRHLLSPAIRSDLDEIAGWLARDNPRFALKVVRGLKAEFRVIAENPMKYRLRPDIGIDLRLAVVGHNVVLFRIDGDIVRFERIVYAGRDLPPLSAWNAVT